MLLYNWINSGYDDVPIFCRFPEFKFSKSEFANFEFAKFEFAKFEFAKLWSCAYTIYCRFAKFEFAKFEFEFTKFEFPQFEFAKFEFPQFEFAKFDFAKFEFPKFKGIKMVQLFCDVAVFLQPTREKEVPEKVQKKSQQSQEVCALIKYTCYPLLCLLDIWSTFGGLMQLKQIPLLI